MPFEIIALNFNDDTIRFKPKFCTHEKTLPICNLLNKQGHRYCGSCFEKHGINTYNMIVKCVEEKDCKMITTKHHFMELNMGTRNKIKVIGKCQHEFEMKYWDFKNGTALCPQCINIHRSITRTDFYTDNKDYSQTVEVNATNIFRECFSNDFDIIRIPSCLADILIKPKEITDDIWLPIQLKSTNQKDSGCRYKFDIKRNDYTNTVLVCVCVSENKFWIFRGIDIPKRNAINIYSKTEDSKSIHNNTFVSNDNLVSHMKKLYNESTITESKDILSVPLAPKHKLEYKYKLIREEKFNKIINFEYQDADSFVYDFIVNQLKVQEKVAFPEKNYPYMYRVNLRKVKTQTSKMPYNENDNDVYWFHIVDTNIFYIIPNEILVKLKYLTTATEPGKMALLLYPNYIQKEKGRQILSLELNKYQFDYDNINISEIKKIFNL